MLSNVKNGRVMYFILNSRGGGGREGKAVKNGAKQVALRVVVNFLSEFLSIVTI